ncbi:hypothetical protein [Bradyrhizobium neotropicale]|uniref:hypothetical protein n=1 Tax=Bradyrhizobium neotropicale TaxID=1497615 RepID=UPI001AD78D4F|nr:hypothetical protein [Bradyrhizobium neotropicale]MBO4226440.1 hypothetical protein [Bradyrhizobium neotropicale]
MKPTIRPAPSSARFASESGRWRVQAAEPLKPASCFRYGLLRFERNDDVAALGATNQPDGQITESLSIPRTKNNPLSPSGKSVI